MFLYTASNPVYSHEKIMVKVQAETFPFAVSTLTQHSSSSAEPRPPSLPANHTTGTFGCIPFCSANSATRFCHHKMEEQISLHSRFQRLNKFFLRQFLRLVFEVTCLSQTLITTLRAAC